MSYPSQRRRLLGAVAAVVVLAPAAASAQPSFTTMVGPVSPRVESLREMKFRGVVRQKYDFSCGSAALATLLTYHYERPVSEEEVFRTMFAVGDQEAIQRHGFSLLDMRSYLDSIGLHAEGYRVPLAEVARVGVPGIALVDVDGYRHFVVIKGVDNGDVLVGDPARGVRAYDAEAFGEMWDGIILAIHDDVETARARFNQEQAWNAYRRLDPARLSVERPLRPVTLMLPGFGYF